MISIPHCNENGVENKKNCTRYISFKGVILAGSARICIVLKFQFHIRILRILNSIKPTFQCICSNYYISLKIFIEMLLRLSNTIPTINNNHQKKKPKKKEKTPNANPNLDLESSVINAAISFYVVFYMYFHYLIVLLYVDCNIIA